MNTLSEDSTTPLIVAASNGNVGAVECLLQNGAILDVADASEKTALYWAAKSNAVETLKVFIQSTSRHKIVSFFFGNLNIMSKREEICQPSTMRPKYGLFCAL